MLDQSPNSRFISWESKWVSIKLDLAAILIAINKLNGFWKLIGDNNLILTLITRL